MQNPAITAVFRGNCARGHALALALALIAAASTSPAMELGSGEPVPPAPTPRLDIASPAPLATKLSIRQNGANKEPGLLRDMKGPAALFDLDLGDHRAFRSIAGALDAPGAHKRGYVAGSGIFQPLAATDLRLSYVADEHGGAAVESRLSRSIDDVRFSFSSTFNRGFESKYTGAGERNAERILEGGLQWNAFSQYPVGGAVRETTRADGSRGLDFRTLQMAPLGGTGGWIMNTTVTPLQQADPATSGTLMYYGPLGGLFFTAEIDYGGPGKGLQPTEARFAVEKTLDDGWSLFASGSKPFSTQPGRVDIGAVREIAGFMASASAGASFDGAAYVGMRLWLPLSDSGKDTKWGGF